MRTTIDLPDDLHELAQHLAREGNRSMSEVIAELIRVGLRRDPRPTKSSVRGLPVLSISYPVSPENVRSLDDEE